MRLRFNTTGPCDPDEHYMIPPERRLGEVLELIEDRRYFTLHAGRQTGKTTSVMWLERHLNAQGHVRAIAFDIQTAGITPDLVPTMRTILDSFDQTLSSNHSDLERPTVTDIDDFMRVPETAVLRYLRHLCAHAAKPVVLFLDETDGLAGEAMVSFLRQLRQGYISRKQIPFPASIVLVGMRQVRDYVLSSDLRHAVSWLGTASPFNISAEAMTLAPFTAAEVEELLLQHTTATGQIFEKDAMALIYELGQGHPWLTNALADQIVRKDVKNRSLPITTAHVEAAKETIILERRSHIDSLMARLREDRVRRILDPMMAGERAPDDLLDDDFAYVLGLGLIRKVGGHFQVANPIYREIIPRALNSVQQSQIWNEPAAYVQKDGLLDMAKLMKDWQIFWREDGHLAAEGFGYRESGPHLMLMAFLQRVVNGGGRIQREYGLGRGALDILIEWKTERYPIEVKIRRDSYTEGRSLQQLGRYMDQSSLKLGWLVFFDMRKEFSWEDKLYQRDVEYEDKMIRIIGG